MSSGSQGAGRNYGGAVPIPTKPIPIRPSGREETSPFARWVNGRRVVGTEDPAPVDPGAIARLERIGRVTVTEEVVGAKKSKVVRKVKKRAPRPGEGTGRRMEPTYNVEECLELAATGQWTANDLAARYGVEPHTIRARLRLGRVALARSVNHKKIVEMYAEGLTVGQIRDATGYAPATIYRAINDSPDVERRDDRNRRKGTLMPETREKVIELDKAGTSGRGIARALGISPSSVRRVLEKSAPQEVEDGE